MADNEKQESINDQTRSMETYDNSSDPNLRNVVSLRNKLYLLVQSRRFQLSVVILVIFDCLLVIMEVLLDLRIVIMHSDKTPADVLHYLSISILSIFMLEVMLKIYVYRLDFFKHKLEVFDAIIVIISFSLDIAFRFHYDGVNGIGLLIILRLWRVARILNGIVLSVKKQASMKLEVERGRRQKLEHELNKFNELCKAQENEIKLLKSILDQNNVEYPLTSDIDIIEKPHIMTFNDSKLSFIQNSERQPDV